MIMQGLNGGQDIWEIPYLNHLTKIDFKIGNNHNFS